MSVSPSKPFDRRRVARAVILSLAVILALGGVTGIATSEQTEGASAPSQFSLAPRLANDRALYNLTIYNATDAGLLEGRPAHPFLEFQWQDPRLLPDRNSTLRTGRELVTLRHDKSMASFDGRAVATPRLLAYSMDGAELLYSGHSALANSSTVSPYNSMGVLEQWDRTYSQLVRWYPGLDSTYVERLCLAENLLQGRTVSLEGTVNLFGACYIQIADVRLDAPGFRAIGTDAVQGHETVVFERVDDRYPLAQVWLSEQIPYPVRLVVEGHDEASPHVYVLELVDFERGAAAPDARHVRIPFAPASRSSLTPWMLDDAGIAHPFPLSQAYTIARDDPDYGGLREFLKKHPDAYVRFAQSSVRHQSDSSELGKNVPAVESQFSWTIALADGPEEFAFEITQLRSNNAPQSFLRTGRVPSLEPEYRYNGFGYSAGPAPPKDLLPSTLPRVDALLRSWKTHVGGLYADREPTSYGFQVMCDAECDEATIELYSGLNEDIASDCWPSCGTSGTRTRDWRYSTLVLDENMVASRYDEFLGTQTGRHDLTAEANPVSGSGPSGSGLAAQPVYASHARTPFWTMPDAATAASVSVVGVVLGLVYLFWPTLKQIAFVGLFSRIERPRALDHPARAQIHELLGHDPGLHFLEIVRRTGLSRGQAEHHLRKLVATGLVVQRASPGFTCYFVAGSVDGATRAQAPVLKADGARRLMDHVRTHPGSSLTQAAHDLSLSVPTVKYHADRLEQAGAVRIRKDGPKTLLYAASALVAEST